MHVEKYAFDQVPYLSKSDVAYQIEPKKFQDFIEFLPHQESFSSAMQKRRQFPVDRKLLVEVLLQQYEGLTETDVINEQIEKLKSEDTFVVVTAHQPSLCTGPLYFIYKILSAINLAESLNQENTDFHIVPVFIIGGEDHDFEEVNHFKLRDHVLEWTNSEVGSVGRMSTEGLPDVMNTARKILGNSRRTEEILSIFERPFADLESYGKAVFSIVHQLFGAYGLVVINMDHRSLKRKMGDIFRDDLIHHTSKALVEKAQQKLANMGFGAQAFPREINLFYLKDGMRERIEVKDGHYFILNTNIEFSQTELLKELEDHPERFSPNVILRPLYQERILPNIAYIGGGGELAYWMERKEQFKNYGVFYPVLLRRDSVLWVSSQTQKWMKKMGVELPYFFDEEDAIIRKYLSSHIPDMVLNGEKTEISRIWEEIEEKARTLDPTLGPSADAALTRVQKEISRLETRMFRASKRQEETAVNRIRKVRSNLFPGGSLQERKNNVIEYLFDCEGDFLEILKSILDPLDPNFKVIYE